MATSIQTDINLKKLMKIIYQKEKQVQKYRRQLREKQRSKQSFQNQIENPISVQERENITKQIYENQQFLSTAGLKINQMENKIINLHNQLAEQQEINAELQKEIKELKVLNKQKIKEIHNLQVQKLLHEQNKGQTSEKLKSYEKKIESYKQENFKLKKINQMINKQRNELSEQIAKIQTQVSHQIHEISKNMRKLGAGKINSKVKIPKIGSSIFLQARSQRKLKSSYLLESESELKDHHQKNSITQKVQMLVSIMTKWQDALSQSQEELRQRFQRQLNEHSIIGIQKLIEQSEIIEVSHQHHLSPSYLQNQDDLLKKLEEQCAKSQPYQIEKQKLIELSEVKQSLKMTKQVNVQLFQELGRKDSELNKLKESLQNFQTKLNKGVLTNKN